MFPDCSIAPESFFLGKFLYPCILDREFGDRELPDRFSAPMKHLAQIGDRTSEPITMRPINILRVFLYESSRDHDHRCGYH
jgi:hypothetical protein